MPYLVFARKYRPQVFDDVIGQEHITTTLANAISLGRVAHAYLFAGPRGIGKTTTARILAKALNCEKGPAPVPCNSCASCVEITQGSSLDIIEIDGASNRGIDEVRNLREGVKFSPSRGRYKVYIIDEVHMLTAEAFNALLKTLEEPPQHVKFVFATTQPHRVPPTILSRCQRFDFRRIPSQKIISSLKEISKKEGLDVADEALELIARYSDGSMRDAEVVLDQMASFAKGRMTADDVVDMLGVIPEERLFGLTDSISSRDANSALLTIQDLIDSGKDPGQILANLIEHFRNLIVVKVAPDAPDQVEASPEKIERLKGASSAFSPEELLYCLYSLANASELTRRTSLTRIPLEVAVVKLCGRASIISLDEILKKIKELKGMMGNARISNAPAQPPPRKEEVSQPQSDKAISPSAAPPSQPAQASSVEEVARAWQAILNHIRTKKISIASYLLEGRPSALEGNILTVAFSPEFRFHKEVLEGNVENKAIVEGALGTALGGDYRVKFTLDEEIPSSGGDNSKKAPEDASGEGRSFPAIDRISKRVDPIIEEAIDIFNGGVVAREKFSGKEKSKG